jgi:hypothetical protein
VAKNKQTHRQADSEPSDQPSQTTGDLEQRAFDPTRSKEEAKVYDEAMAQNREHEFIGAIMEARKPQEVKEYTPPQVSAAIAEQTRLEMAAGAKRVAEFAAQEAERQAVHERNKRDKWADKESVPVFRPDDYVPDQKKGQGNITATSAPLKE